MGHEPVVKLGQARLRFAELLSRAADATVIRDLQGFVD